MSIRCSSYAFVIKRTNRGESDQIITFYTKDFGKIDVLGKGIRKIMSKLNSNTDDFSLLYIEFIETSKRKTLVESKKVKDFLKIRKDIERIKFFSKIKKSIDSLLKGEERDEDIWLLLQKSVFEIEREEDFYLSYYYFFWNLIVLLGYKPNFDCKNCKGDKSCILKAGDKECFSSAINVIKNFIENDLREKIKQKDLLFIEDITEKAKESLIF